MPSTCPLCASAATELFLRREAVPVHQNLLVESAPAARAVARGELSMCVCHACGFVFNAAFDATLLAYGEHYDNTQTYSELFKRHMDALADHLVNQCGVTSARIVEVGCGKGDFLHMLLAKDERNTGVGFDPSYLGPDTQLGGRLRFERRMFGGPGGVADADVVVCRHVIEHVPAPLELLVSVKRALSERGDPRLFFETPCVEWIFQHVVIWDFFYEHCSLFSTASLTRAFRTAGFRVAGVRSLFGEQYLWIEASLRGEDGYAPSPADAVVHLARRFRERGETAVRQWAGKIEALRSNGRVAVWGAGAKGATFVNLVDPDGSRIDCVVDINPNKQGRFIPGTGHAIVAPHELADRGISAALVMNPNYLAEAQALLARSGIRTTLLT